MKEIGAVTIAKLIEAHHEKNEHKFLSYAKFIAETYKEKGEDNASKIILSRIYEIYKNKPVVVALDKEKQMTEGQIEGGELYEYEACEVPIKQIKKMVKNGTWEDSLEEEEVLYNLENNLYSESYAESVRKIIKAL